MNLMNSSEDEKMPIAIAATREELANQLRRHYDEVSSQACDWHSAMLKAIEAWEREPLLLQQIIELEGQLEGYRGRGKMKRIAERVKRITGWKRFALRQLLRLWRLMAGVFAAMVLIGLLTPCVLIYIALESPSLLDEALLVGVSLLVIGVLGMIFTGLIEEAIWPTWFN